MTKILIIEDDEFLRALTAKRLEKENYQVAVAVDGETALATVQTEKPDLILLDLLLPGLDGFAVLEKIKADSVLKKIPVIVFSNLGSKQDVERATGLGAADYLIKSNFTLDDVVAKIKDQLK